MNKGIIILLGCLLLLISTNRQFVKDNCKILLLGTVLMITYLYHHPDVIEGAETKEIPSPGYKSFYTYFGREKNEASPSSGKGSPPNYTPTNINLADLKGELSFFKNEFLPDSKPYDSTDTVDFIGGRKYGIQYIDKWLLRYQEGFNLGDFLSMQDNMLGPCGSDGKLLSDSNLLSDELLDGGKECDPSSAIYQGALKNITNKKIIGSGIQDHTHDASKDGYWLSILGDCPNKPVSEKYIDGKKTPDPSCIPNNYKVKVYDGTDYTSADSKPTDSNPIIAIYVGTVRLDDLANRGGKGKCFDNITKVYDKTFKKKFDKSGKYTSDLDVPIWSDFMKGSKGYDTYDAYKLLNNPDSFNCRLQGDGSYKTGNLKNIPVADSKIDGIGSGGLVPIDGRKPGNPDKPGKPGNPGKPKPGKPGKPVGICSADQSKQCFKCGPDKTCCYKDATNTPDCIPEGDPTSCSVNTTPCKYQNPKGKNKKLA